MTNSVQTSLQKSGIQKQTAQILANTPLSVAQASIPVILAASGTVISIGGELTLGTALPLVYTGAWVQLPAGAVVGGAAGLYFTVFSTTAIGQVYTAYADPSAGAFTPYTPTTLVAAVGKAGATVAATTEKTLINVTIPANSIGDNGSVKIGVLTSNTASADDKTIKVKFGGTAVVTNVNTTPNTLFESVTKVANRGAQNKQVVYTLGTNAASAAVPTQLTINTGAAVTVLITGTLEAVTDNLVIESFNVDVLAA
jgi:hypothetical protein